LADLVRVSLWITFASCSCSRNWLRAAGEQHMSISPQFPVRKPAAPSSAAAPAVASLRNSSRGLTGTSNWSFTVNCERLLAFCVDHQVERKPTRVRGTLGGGRAMMRAGACFLCVLCLGATCAVAQVADEISQTEPYNKHYDRRLGHDHVYPDRGAVFRDVPRGATVVNYAGLSLRFYNGIWFEPRGPAFIVVMPPVGLVVPALPSFSTPFESGGQEYLYANDVYYLARPDLGGYQVVNDPADVAPPVARSTAGVSNAHTSSSASGAPAVVPLPNASLSGGVVAPAVTPISAASAAQPMLAAAPGPNPSSMGPVATSRTQASGLVSAPASAPVTAVPSVAGNLTVPVAAPIPPVTSAPVASSGMTAASASTAAAPITPSSASTLPASYTGSASMAAPATAAMGSSSGLTAPASYTGSASMAVPATAAMGSSSGLTAPTSYTNSASMAAPATAAMGSSSGLTAPASYTGSASMAAPATAAMGSSAALAPSASYPSSPSAATLAATAAAPASAATTRSAYAASAPTTS